MPRRSRAQQVADEKGELRDHMTSGELRAFLNISWPTFRRWQESGKIPSAAARTAHGWALWSPDQVTALLRKITRS